MAEGYTTKTEALVTPEVLRRRYLHGIRALDDDGNEVLNTTLGEIINNAIGWLEQELDIPIIPVQYSVANGTAEHHDYRYPDFWNWNFIRLDVYPVISVETVKLQFPTATDLIDYPTSWFRLEKDTGIMRLVADAHSVPAVLTQSGLLIPQLAITRRMIPQMIQVEYTAGLPLDQIPVLLNNIIGLKAAIDYLAIAGDLVAGNSVASQSVGLDGISQSTSTTKSGQGGAYAGRIDQYESQLYGTKGATGSGKSQKVGLLERAKLNYKGIQFDTI